MSSSDHSARRQPETSPGPANRHPCVVFTGHLLSFDDVHADRGVDRWRTRPPRAIISLGPPNGSYTHGACHTSHGPPRAVKLGGPHGRRARRAGASAEACAFTSVECLHTHGSYRDPAPVYVRIFFGHDGETRDMQHPRSYPIGDSVGESSRNLRTPCEPSVVTAVTGAHPAGIRSAIWCIIARHYACPLRIRPGPLRRARATSRSSSIVGRAAIAVTPTDAGDRGAAGVRSASRPHVDDALRIESMQFVTIS